MERSQPPADVQTIEIRDSPGYYATMTAVLVGLAVLFSEPWLAAILCSNALWTLWRTLANRVRLQITAEGIADYTTPWSPTGEVPWDQIRDIREVNWGGIEIEVVDERSLLDRFSTLGLFARGASTLLGIGPMVIWPMRLDRSKRELLELLETRLDAHTLAAAQARAGLGPEAS